MGRVGNSELGGSARPATEQGPPGTPPVAPSRRGEQDGAAETTLGRRSSVFTSRTALAAILITALLIPLNAWLASRRGDELGPDLGTHVHAMTYLEEDLLVLGHDGSARQRGTSWTSEAALNRGHSTAAAATAESTLVLSDGELLEVGGPRGISPLTTTMAPLGALGASGRIVYAVSMDGSTGISRDNGHTFEWVKSGGVTTPVTGPLAVNPRRPQQVWGVANGGTVWSTDDNGASWVPVTTPGPAQAIAVGGTDRATLAVLTDDGIEVSLDDGQTWRDTKAPDALQSLTVNEAGELTAATTVDSRVLTFTYRDGEWRALV